VIRTLALACMLVVAAPAAAEDIKLPNSRVVLHLGEGWQLASSDGVVAGYRKGEAALAVTRAQVPNPEAWRSKTKQAYADVIERGVAAAIPGYKRVSKKLVEMNGIPALDIEARREGGKIVVVRVLLFRTYAMSVAIETPARDVAVARTIATTFGPSTMITDAP
jgi:hypothetical protein